MTGIGNRAELRADQVLAAVSALQADGYQPLTGDIAARLGIRARSVERDRLNDLLWHLHRARKLKYEREPVSGLFRWRAAGVVLSST